jgi:heme exporter protein D
MILLLGGFCVWLALAVTVLMFLTGAKISRGER